jgi:hypothetical protein
MVKFAVEDISERYLTLSREQVARCLQISTDALDALHERSEGPPRFRQSPRRWAYPAQEFRKWQEKRLAEAQANNAA